MVIILVFSLKQGYSAVVKKYPLPELDTALGLVIVRTITCPPDDCPNIIRMAYMVYAVREMVAVTVFSACIPPLLTNAFDVVYPEVAVLPNHK